MSGSADAAAQRSYVIYAPTSWDSPRQPAHNLADALAVQHRVLYVDPALSPLTPIRYGLRETTWPRLLAVVDRRLRRAGRLQVFAPLVLPPIEHPQMRALSLPLLRAQIARAVRRAGMDRPIVLAWRGLPELADVAHELLRVGVVMDHPSGGATLLGRPAAELEAEMARLCESSEFVCTTSHPMHELLAERGWQNELVPFGFPADLAEVYDTAPEPAEYATLARPLLGYTGGIDDRLDYELIVRLAERFCNGSLVFVGAISPRLPAEARRALQACPNIHLLGSRPRTQLPGYIRHLDVALLPYEDSLFTQYQSPMKMWEYLYAGPPIVGTGSTELRRYPPPLVSYAESVREAIALTERALLEPATGREERRSFALTNTWEDRAAQLDALAAAWLDGAHARAAA